MYNSTRTSSGHVLPLIMGFTTPTPIEVEDVENKIFYDPITQKVVMDLRVVGTKCLKTRGTKNPKTHGNSPDMKNEIDDNKNVK